MKLPDALRGIRQMVFDTPPLIQFIERHPVYFDRMLFIMRYVDQGLIAGVSSSIALTEVLVQPIKSGDNLRTPDALHLATALEAGCDAFLTNDLELKRVTELRVLVLNELEIDPA